MLTGLEIGLTVALSYLLGTGTGALIVVKNRNNLFLRSKSMENLSLNSNNNHHNLSQRENNQPVIVPSAPVNTHISKITLE